MKGMINLEEIIPRLNLRIKLKKSFTNDLFQRASKCDKPHCNLEFIRALGMKPTTKYLNTTIIGWIKKERALDIDILIKLLDLSKKEFKDIQDKIISVNSKGRGTEVMINFPIILDKRLGSIIGHILGDGSIDKKYQQVFFSNSDKKLLDEFAQNMKGVFNLEPRIWMQKEPEFGNTKWEKRLNSTSELQEGRNAGLFYPSACGLLLNALFNNFAIGKTKSITKELLDTNRDFKSALIRAFYDDEATVGEKSIRIFQDRRNILETFRELLCEFNISSGEVKTYMKRDKERYYYNIHKKSNLRKFEEEIGFTSSKKREKLNKITSKKAHFNDE